MILKVLQEGMGFRRLLLLASFTHVFSPGIPNYSLSVFSWQLLHSWAANRSSGALQNLVQLTPVILALMYFAMQSQNCYIMVKEGGEVKRGAEQGWGNSQRQGRQNLLNCIEHANMQHNNVGLNQECPCCLVFWLY